MRDHAAPLHLRRGPPGLFGLLVALLPSACADDPAVNAATAERTRPPTVATSGLPTDTGGPDGLLSDTEGPSRDAQDTGALPEPDTATSDLAEADTGPAPSAPQIALPRTLALPFVRANGSPSTATFRFPNDGAPGAVSVSLAGNPLLALEAPPSRIDESLELTLRFQGSASPVTAEGRLRVTLGGVTQEAIVFAVAGRALPAATWTPLETGATRYGSTTTVALDTAPFPDPGAAWTDPSVNVFVPEDFVDRGPIEYVVHFHGHGTTLASTLVSHRYREQLWASGANAILVTPQGPINAASGNFGKLMREGGLTALLADVTTLLYRDGLVQTPRTGNVTLTEHSGGYQAVALNLDAAFDDGLVVSAHLFDGLYGYASAYEAFARAGGYLRSNHTAGGGTRTKNLALLGDLGALATDVATAKTLRDATAIIWPTFATHNDSTWWEQAFSETLRWGAHSARRGPRVELRSAIAEGGVATVTWFTPEDDFTSGYRIEVSTDGKAWTTATTTPNERATFPLAGGRWVRVTPIVEDVEDPVPSDAGFVEDDAEVLVVDGFDRIFGGSWTDLRHDHAGRVASLAKAATASNEAVVEGEVALTDFAVVIWLLGDESVADHTFTSPEQSVLTRYLDAGGRVLVSGSEVAFDLKTNGQTFLSRLGAVYVGDDANQLAVRGVGPLAGVGNTPFGGPGAPYPEDFPDILGTASGASIILQYANGMTAGVGRAGESAVLGFPLETVESDTQLATLLAALRGFLAP
jgi:hypothetical protein